MKKNIFYFVLFIIFSILTASLYGQNITDKDIASLVKEFKADERGPYQAIRWFCPDGTVLPPTERCTQPGGVQHALNKNIVTKLAVERGIYLGQILAGTEYEIFWDEKNEHSRLLQYIIENYLRSIDNGWILRRAQYYRGAFQDEDENDWGHKFLLWVVKDNTSYKKNFFILRQAVRSIPHNTGDSRWENIRAVSKTLSDSLPSFYNLRVKLHGQPDISDLQRLREYRSNYRGRFSQEQIKLFDTLEQDLIYVFQPINFSKLKKIVSLLPKDSKLANDFAELSALSQSPTLSSATLIKLIDLMWQCRIDLNVLPKPEQKLAALDLSVALENILFREVNSWQTNTIYDIIEKSYYLTRAAAAAGFLEIWEYQEIDQQVKPSPDTSIKLTQLKLKSEYIKRALEWSAGMVRANYQEPLALFNGFEPLCQGFIDDRIRVSVLLPLGNIAGQLNDLYMSQAGIKQQVLDIPSQNQVRGINPGYALGELIVLNSLDDETVFSKDKIYVLSRTPSDLKPVAGLLTVSEGNLVSHVQLLARNLGIPNAVITRQNLEELLKYNYSMVFYAVSPSGGVQMKSVRQMTDEENALVISKPATENLKITVPTDKLLLDKKDLIDLRQLRASHSGKLTGPKAANMGQLKSMFPENVVEGVVLPFGIYREHMNQIMPGEEITYWQYLNDTFSIARNMKQSDRTDNETEKFILTRLETLRNAIKQMSFLPGFYDKLNNAFKKILGKPMGSVPVFIRSDTNMEDLKDFTGAGLNLTVFNVRDEQKILQGIRDVWASPFSERSYQWRQKILLNPENVYPSILIIPSVNVDKSGVIITTGVFSGNPDDITIAFNRGAGGAVEGQIAESYNLYSSLGYMLLSPVREKRYTFLPPIGGVEKHAATFEDPILKPDDIKQIRQLVGGIKNKLPGAPGMESSGPWDIELGFYEGKIWLFQIRPFVENKRAKSYNFLNAMDHAIDLNKIISLKSPLKQ
ncbi:phosphoenolpyruvate synthase [candidate division KSB1 bacterium]|nr:phosphoenolpyruvate synthase [candidate division KSB1 bacterium]